MLGGELDGGRRGHAGVDSLRGLAMVAVGGAAGGLGATGLLGDEDGGAGDDGGGGDGSAGGGLDGLLEKLDDLLQTRLLVLVDPVDGVEALDVPDVVGQIQVCIPRPDELGIQDGDDVFPTLQCATDLLMHLQYGCLTHTLPGANS